MPNYSPADIVAALDNHIIGQSDAKRAIALAFRNRWRRMQITDETLRYEITPKNMLMIGPTGVGKTEIARRLAKLAQAPFIKVEATKFTEVGYVGRDVESIIRDLMDIGFSMAKRQLEEKHAHEAEEQARDLVVNALKPIDDAERRKMELRVEADEMDDQEVEIEFTPPETKYGINIAGTDNSAQHIEELGESLRSMVRQFKQPNKTVKKSMPLGRAFKHFRQEALNHKVNNETARDRAVELVQENGIVFIDEIDKIVSKSDHQTSDISRQGVQRDLLPLVEGTTVQTKYGPVETTHILFIASGSFHYSNPSDLIPELQGRLPVRVNLSSLTVKDFEKILNNTDSCLIKQYQALLATEGVKLKFSPSAIERIAQIAFAVNEQQENIGARRLHTVMEKLLEEISFDADTRPNHTYRFGVAAVNAQLDELSKDKAASRIFL